ncbi:hypothetical protein ACFQU1_11850 [Chelatococcus sp. GCM10030263]|uniref:hypothetical protein n=1 Tax=Chelatococcus sp. GCM10030263 TaxID=3273387 RepID=UPI00360E11AB
MSDTIWKGPNWSKEARLSSQVWFCMDAATRFILFERWGREATVELEFQFMRQHQLTHFLDGVQKLNLMSDPHPQLCAKYHCLSNLLGGIDMGYRDEGERAWVFYMPPHFAGASPLLPGPATPAVPIDIMMANFKAWHANNGVLLGNDRLRFVATDLIFAGGPFDAGYWDEAPRPLGPDERLEIRLGEVRGRPGPPPELGVATWPQERRNKALRKYNAEYGIGGLAEIARRRTMEEAVIIGEASHRAVFVSWARHLIEEFGIKETRPGARTADLFQKSFELLQDEFDRHAEGKDQLLVHKRTRLSVPQYENWQVPPRPIEEAFARAWTVVSRAVGDPVEVSIVQSRSEGADHTIWRLRPTDW